MNNGSYELDGFLFGRGTDVDVSQTTIDMGAMTTQDVATVGADGRAFGRDYLPGTSITFTGQVRVPGEPATALARYNDLAAAWVNPDVRLNPGKVSTLRAWYPGADGPVTAYGRGRQIAPTLGMVRFGLVSYVAQFDLADANFYSDELYSIEIGLLPSTAGGVVPPVIPPVILASVETQDNHVVNAGAATWPVIHITGPITNPVIMYPNLGVRCVITATVPEGRTLTLDARPWARTITLDTGASFAGMVTGSRLVDLRLPTGSTLVAFSGQDLTGQARMTFTWRTAGYSLGGI